jgi:cytidyltransferase-related domain
LKRVITFGTFDILHVGHLSILKRAAELGEHLTVGISTDALNISKKGRAPVYPEAQRLALVAALRCVDATFLEHSLEAKRNYVREHGAEVLVMGDDWAGHFDDLSDLCKVIYLPRTPAISTTAVIEMIRR